VEPADRLVVLDRDGVINVDSDAYIKSPEEWHAIPGALEAIARLTRHGFRVFVVSNQSGIARGLLTQTTLERINERMRTAVAATGGSIEAIYVCPHHPDDGCACRKPRPGMLRQLEAEHGVSLAGVPLIGDKWSDLEVARAVGARPMLVLTGSGQRTLEAHRHEVDQAFRDLAAVVDLLVTEA